MPKTPPPKKPPFKAKNAKFRPLTPAEQAFVDAYVGGDPYDAVVAAGYEGTDASTRARERVDHEAAFGATLADQVLHERDRLLGRVNPLR